MLTLITGNPGNGKSLFTVTTVEALRLKEAREVYQDGISGLTFPWKALPLIKEERRDKQGKVLAVVEVVDWSNVPDTSIVVIDEAWRLFPIRRQGSEVPAFVQFLATHRHHGLDIFLATQQVKTQVDTFVRGLVGKHIHLDRKFGMAYAQKYEWERVADPTSTKDLSIAQLARWPFPKAMYGTYQSAVEHTHRVNLPWKKILTLVVALVVVVSGIWGAFAVLKPKRPVGEAGDRARGVAPPLKVALADYWVRDRRERVQGIPASAPVYDRLQVPKSQPRVDGCMRLDVGASVRCECTGPNHVVLDIPVAQCVEAVKRGFFDETRGYRDSKAENIAYLNSLERGGGSSSSSSSSSSGGGKGDDAP